MRKFLIEREIEGAGKLDAAALAEAARTSNRALAELAPHVQWQQSYVTENGTTCVYLAESEEAIREHARLSGFPAHRITELRQVIDPSTAQG